jgi:hypothetical protein
LKHFYIKNRKTFPCRYGIIFEAHFKEKTMKKKFSKTPRQVIEDHFLKFHHETGISGATFVAMVREHYESSYEDSCKGFEWSRNSDPHTRMSRDCERFKSWLGADAKANFPYDISESVIAAFPDERRLNLQIELMARQGLGVFVMPASEKIDGITIGQFNKEVGEALIAVSQMLIDDERINKLDPDTEIDQAISVMMAIKALRKNKSLRWMFSTFSCTPEAEKV